MTTKFEVLVALLNYKRDFSILREEHWYRIPTDSVESRLKKRWPPQWLAFYQTKEFGNEAYAVNYFSEVEHIKKAKRRQLFPKEPRNEQSEKEYFKISIGELQRLSKPILSRRFRRIIFISTTLEKLVAAEEINDLFDESTLEDKMWAEFKRVRISARICTNKEPRLRA